MQLPKDLQKTLLAFCDSWQRRAETIVKMTRKNKRDRWNQAIGELQVIRLQVEGGTISEETLNRLIVALMMDTQIPNLHPEAKRQTSQLVYRLQQARRT